MSRYAVLDFETTGLSTDNGDRATEVAIVVTEGGKVVDRYQSLMNAGAYISAFITEYTGITNEMVKAAPAAAVVMKEAARFVGNTPLVAHNASFDRRFWGAELARIGLSAANPFLCTLLLSRRLYTDAPNHRLGTLVDHLRLPRAGVAHRALADAEMAASLLHRILHDLRHTHGIVNPDASLLLHLQGRSKPEMPAVLSRLAATTAG